MDPEQAREYGLIDKVFTRVGASDNLSQGESTFMLEMIETSSILNNLSERSLILMIGSILPRINLMIFVLALTLTTMMG